MSRKTRSLSRTIARSTVRSYIPRRILIEYEKGRAHGPNKRVAIFAKRNLCDRLNSRNTALEIAKSSLHSDLADIRLREGRLNPKGRNRSER